MEEETRPTLSLGDRAQLGLVWFVVGGIALAVVTIVPAAIVGFAVEPFHRFVYLSALVVGIGGAIYGRYPPGLS
jgi:hypothetical protein